MQVRPQWVGYQGVERDAAEQVTLDNFAFEHSADILRVEPRLATLAELVRLAKPDADLLDRLRYVASAFLGPDRQVTLWSVRDNTAHKVGSAMHGATTLRRYLQALESLTGDGHDQQ